MKDDNSNPLGDLPDARPVVLKSRPYFGLVAFFLGVFLVVSIIGVAYYYYSYIPALQEANIAVESPKSETQTATDPTADWKVYTADTFIIKYPSNWFIFKEVALGRSEVIEYNISNRNNYDGMDPNQLDKEEVHIYINERPDQYTSIFSALMNLKIGERTTIDKVIYEKNADIMIDNIPAIVYSYSENGATKQVLSAYEVILMKSKAVYYKIHMVGAARTAKENNNKIFNQILSTFKFTDQNQAVDTSNWKTYKDKNNKFSFKIPPNWNVAGSAVNGEPAIENDISFPVVSSFYEVSDKNEDILYCESHRQDTQCGFLKTSSADIVINWGKFTSPISKEMGVAEARYNNKIVRFYIGDITNQSQDSLRQVLSTFRFTN